MTAEMVGKENDSSTAPIPRPISRVLHRNVQNLSHYVQANINIEGNLKVSVQQPRKGADFLNESFFFFRHFCCQWINTKGTLITSMKSPILYMYIYDTCIRS